jgi:hypothetical protein
VLFTAERKPNLSRGETRLIQRRIELNDATDRSQARVWRLAWICDIGQRRTASRGSICGKTSSAIFGHLDVPFFLLLDDPPNELLPPAGLGAYRILTHRASGNYFLVLRQYSLLDHPSRFSVDRKSNIPVSAVALSLGRK